MRSYIITQEGYIIAKALLESIMQEGISKGKILAELQGSSFENYRAINPLNGRESLLIVGEHVLISGGSGLVHSAPGHGEEDYFACLKYKLEVLMPVDDRGCYDEKLARKGAL